MGKLVYIVCVLIAGCSGWGDEPVLGIEGSDLSGVGLIQRHSTTMCLDQQDGNSCSDGLWCNGQETCRGGVCVSGEPACETPCDEMHRHCAAECVFDSDCDDGVGCTGEEWCCTWEKSDWHCEKYQCYPGVSPCGQPVWGVLSVCDQEWDTCRSCQADFECDDGCWCNGMERCGTQAEEHHHGVCLHVVGSNPCGEGEYCIEEKLSCEPVPECRQKSDCGPEMWCDENGKCQAYSGT